MDGCLPVHGRNGVKAAEEENGDLSERSDSLAHVVEGLLGSKGVGAQNEVREPAFVGHAFGDAFRRLPSSGAQWPAQEGESVEERGEVRRKESRGEVSRLIL